jgi:inosine-uridine nucleoside N-ribohydrolase
MQVDPEACHIIFESGLPVYMVPLDVTHKAAVTDHVLETIEKRCIPGSNFAKLIIDLLVFFKHTYENVYHLYQGPPLHDPCAVAILIAPEVFTIRHLRVDVVTDNGLALGQTVSNKAGRVGRVTNWFTNMLLHLSLIHTIHPDL